MAGSVAGWIFVITGLFVRYENLFVYYLWLVILFVWCIVHPLELFVTLPMKDTLKTTKQEIILKTIFFGFTWWFPKKKGHLDQE